MSGNTRACVWSAFKLCTWHVAARGARVILLAQCSCQQLLPKRLLCTCHARATLSLLVLLCCWLCCPTCAVLCCVQSGDLMDFVLGVLAQDKRKHSDKQRALNHKNKVTQQTPLSMVRAAVKDDVLLAWSLFCWLAAIMACWLHRQTGLGQHCTVAGRNLTTYDVTVPNLCCAVSRCPAPCCPAALWSCAVLHHRR